MWKSSDFHGMNYLAGDRVNDVGHAPVSDGDVDESTVRRHRELVGSAGRGNSVNHLVCVSGDDGDDLGILYAHIDTSSIW